MGIRVGARLGIAVETIAGEDCPNREAAIAWIAANQLGRRNLTPSQKTPLGRKLEKQWAAAAKKRWTATLKHNQASGPERFPDREKGDAREPAAELRGLNPHYGTDAKPIAKEVFLRLNPSPLRTLCLRSFREDARHERQQLFRGGEVFGLARIEMLHPALPLPLLHLGLGVELHDERPLTGQRRLISIHT